MTATYRDIKADILEQIASGRWRPGGLLPNESDLAASYGCARATVNRAMRELAEEGIVERKRKAGTRVRQSPLREARFEIPLVRAEIEARGAVYRYALVYQGQEPAPAWLRARLDLDEEAQALRLVCMHFADGVPYQYEDRWINLGALPQALDHAFDQQGPNEWLVETVPYSDAQISFAAVSADEDVALYLGCAEGDALFQTERSTWWQGQAITYVRLVFQRGYRMSARY
jgi:GntR family histidine utilization transcriptional repressor